MDPIRYARGTKFVDIECRWCSDWSHGTLKFIPDSSGGRLVSNGLYIHKCPRSSFNFTGFGLDVFHWTTLVALSYNCGSGRVLVPRFL